MAKKFYKTLRFKILLTMLLVSLGILIFFAVNWYYEKSKQSIREDASIIKIVETCLLEDYRDLRDFFNIEPHNPGYYETNQSPYIDQHHENMHRMLSLVESLEQSASFGDKREIKEKITSLKALITDYDSTFHRMAKLIYLRGYKDYGIVGKMRKRIHSVEDNWPGTTEQVLMLRRHEKDYIIRHEDVYKEKHQKVYEKLCHEALPRLNIPVPTKKQLARDLDEYRRLFEHFTLIEELLGLHNYSGLKMLLDEQGKQLEEQISELEAYINEGKNELVSGVRFTYTIGTQVIVLILVLAGFYLARRITAPVEALSGYMGRFVQSGFREKEKIEKGSRNDETGQLISNFELLRDEAAALIANFEQKVEERTREIDLQRMRIEKQKVEIENQRNELDHQKQILDVQNKNYKDSIMYASYIQQAMLPDRIALDDLAPENFVFFKPRDVVSGDFYWAEQVVHHGEAYSVFAAVDCTGHGVPGAFLSFLGNSGLNMAVKEEGLIKPKDILVYLNQYIFNSLHKKNKLGRLRDGMDAALCVIRNKTRELWYAGAFNPLYLIRSGQLIEMKANRLPLGVHADIGDKLDEHYMKLEKDDAMYIFTDGFTDQFGGKDGKKFMKRRFKKLLADMAGKPVPVQKRIINETIARWQNAHEQVDDMLVIGMKV
jgi:serine phosphatase RsbU (regulator of sigma subunit)